MRILLASLLLWLAKVTSPVPAGEVLRSEKLVAPREGMEYQVRVCARAPGASWEAPGRECAVIKVYVDDRYDQYLFVFVGTEERGYEFLVGPVDRGEHTLRLEWDKSWTPALAERPALGALEIRQLDPTDPSQEAALRAPILYLRHDTLGRFSDLPLCLYWDFEEQPPPRQVVYTIILSNEDGGTNTERLMARWGRTTDIEWCYSHSQSEGQFTESYQGRDHKTLPFQGRRQGLHPLLYVATENNIFSDAPPDFEAPRVRFAPLFGALSGRSRESVMDRFPWTYQVMAAEMEREDKLEKPGNPDTTKVSDLRNYAYLEVCSRQRGTELYFELQLRGDKRWYSSHHGDEKARIGRSGCFRSTVELPPGTRADRLAALRLQCTRAPVPRGEQPVRSPKAEIESIARLLLLERDYRPGPNLLERAVGRSLKPGQSLTMPLISTTHR